MPIKKLPAGTRIYLTKKRPHELYIQPDKVLVNDSLYAAYDVRMNGHTVIPKGTRVVGNWITESRPVMAAQLQINTIYLCRSGQEIRGDSDVIEALSGFNDNEIDNAPHLTKIGEYRPRPGTIRRIVNVNCSIRVLRDKWLNTVYLEIFTREIPVTLTEEFVPFPSLPNDVYTHVNMEGPIVD